MHGSLADRRPWRRLGLHRCWLWLFRYLDEAPLKRAFVNWMYALCDEVDGGYQFAGIPLRVEFLGIFDTVVSVGIAGGFTSGLLEVEGR